MNHAEIAGRRLSSTPRLQLLGGMLAVLGIVTAGCTGARATAGPPAAGPSAAEAAGETGNAHDASFTPVVGQAGKDVVWVPTSHEVVERMLDLAEVTERDYVIDLGSGDGRNIIAAARRGASGHGVEFNPDMVALSRKLAQEAGVADRATFIEGDMYAADLSKATVLALFLLPTNLEQLKDKFLALPPGTRIVLNTFTLDAWEPDATSLVDEPCTTWCLTVLLVVPANVAGVWDLGTDGQMTLRQEYRALEGTLTTVDGRRVPITGKVSATSVEMSIDGVLYEGRVDGSRIAGMRTVAGGSPVPWSATRR